MTVDKHFKVSVEIIDTGEIGSAESGGKPFLQIFGIVLPHAESADRADIAEDRVPDLCLKLGDKLVSNGEREFVFARLRENGGDGISGDVLELIDI